ncbi:hypothetical protein HMI56_006630 [Coelomomyces lativittatus]|nr:hypothetical protein HMI56_006630 [Coelomomyces lativittatus]
MYLLLSVDFNTSNTFFRNHTLQYSGISPKEMIQQKVTFNRCKDVSVLNSYMPHLVYFQL